MCLLTLLSLFSTQTKLPFVAHLQRGGGDHHRVFFHRHQHACIYKRIREEGVVLGLLKRAFSLMVPVVVPIHIIQTKQRTFANFCLLVRSQVAPLSPFFGFLGLAPPSQFRFPAG